MGAFVIATSAAHHAAAEVVLVKADGWQVSTSGRFGAFFSYAFGDGVPVPHTNGTMTETIPNGAGLDPGKGATPGAMNADGTFQQGTFTSMRVRSGFIPNVITLSLKKQITDATSIEMTGSIWSTLESEALRKTTPPAAYMQEGYVKLTSFWGSVLAGRARDLYSRGATENDLMYGHGYGLGFGGEIDDQGPADGFMGFGIIGAYFAPGIVYATPSLGGLVLTAGVYDPVGMNPTSDYPAVRSARPESELTYDLQSGIIKLHLFGNGEFQKVYKSVSSDSPKTVFGVGYGGRAEFGPCHVGLAGHYGKGIGMHYALENDQKANQLAVTTQDELRPFAGYSALVQYQVGQTWDLNAGWGMSTVSLTASDKADPTVGLPRSEQGYFGAIVYHYTENYHLDLDYFRGHTEWRFGQKQDVNFINFGITATW